MRGAPRSLDDLRQDLRYAARTLRRNPAFAAAAAATLALAIAVNTAMFSVLNTVLLRPLPYRSPEQLAMLWTEDPTQNLREGRSALSDVEQWRNQSRSFADLATFDAISTLLTGADGVEQIVGASISPNLLPLLGVRPVLGRSFSTDEAEQQQPLALISHRFWQARFAGLHDALGATLVLNGVPRRIIGILPVDFYIARLDADVWVPHASRQDVRGPDTWFVVGRLRPAVTFDRAQAEMSAVARRLNDQLPAGEKNRSISVVPLNLYMVGPQSRLALWMLGGAVFCVLLIAAPNVTSLSLARSIGRARETAVRVALGASAGRIARQLLTESVVLAALSGLIGTLLALVGIRLIRAFGPADLLRLNEISLDLRVLGWALAISVLAGILVGVAPTITTLRRNLRTSVEEGGRGVSAGTATRRIRRALVVAEFALAIVLLVGAGLILRSFASLLAVDPGFRTRNVMTMSVQLPGNRYREFGARNGFYSQAFAQVKAIPGVQEVGVAAVTPLTGNNWTSPFERPEQPVPAGERPPEVGWQLASNGYFKSLQIPLISGRLFDDRDVQPGPPVVIVSEAIQKRFFPDESAVGKRVKLQGDQTAEIVGVVGNIRRAGLRDEPRADMYFPFERNKPGQTTLFVRTASDPERLLGTIKAAITRLEPNAFVSDEETLAHVASESERITRVVLWLLGVFAVTSLALAAVGIYGVMSYAVRQRTREIGTRIALGATRRNILWLVLQQGAVIAAVGTVVGLATGLVTTRFLSSILYGVKGTDPLTLTSAVLILVVTIMLACYVPARRAASVDPAKTLAEQ